MTDVILVLNAGSSSLKFAVYEYGTALSLLLRGSISQLGNAPRLKVQAAGQAGCDRSYGAGPMDITVALTHAFAELEARGFMSRIAAAGHRIVHGGERFVTPVRLDAETLTALRDFVPLAPLHQPYNLTLVELTAAQLPSAVQVGCFDTAFHAGRPRLDRLYGLPRDLTDGGIVAYGFHGLSYAHAAAVLREQDGPRAGGRAIVAHLGSGASLCAMDAGQSVATTMGFSALDGLVMSSRCGALDPGIILHLVCERHISAEAVRDLLYERSGLLGVSQLSGDMQTLLHSDDPLAREAIDLFVYRVGRSIGSMAAALGGLDTLVFTAGVGENAPEIRQRIGEAAGWLGVEIDFAFNRRGERRISAAESVVDVLVIPADEERAVAEGTLACARGEKAGAAKRHE